MIRSRHCAEQFQNGRRQHYGFYQDGVWVDLGRAVIRRTFYEEGTGACKLMWTLANEEEWNSESDPNA